MGLMTTGGPAVGGHAWNILAVSVAYSLLETVEGVVPDLKNS